MSQLQDEFKSLNDWTTGTRARIEGTGQERFRRLRGNNERGVRRLRDNLESQRNRNMYMY